MKATRIVLASLAAAVITAAGLLSYVLRGPEYASWVLSVVATLGLVVSLFNWAFGHGRPVRADSAPELNKAAAHLADRVRRQWDDHARRLQMDLPRLAATWRLTPVVAAPEPGSVVRTSDAQAIARWFLGLGHRRLLLQGEPGMGKTSLAIKLRHELQELHTEIDAEHTVVPALFFVHGWDRRFPSLNEWLVHCLERDYPSLRATFGADAPRHLVETGRVLPILDGLDELPEILRDDLQRKLGQQTATDRLIVTTRLHRGTDTAGSLIMAGRAAPEPLTARQIADYITGCTDIDPRARDTLVRAVTGDPRGHLARALRTPLALWLLRTGCRHGTGVDPLLACESARDVVDRLLDGLLPALLDSHPPNGVDAPRRRWPEAQARRVLTFLAGQLGSAHRDNMAWWELGGTGRYLHTLAPMLVLTALGGLVGSLAGASFGLVFGIWMGFLTFALIFGPQPRPTATIADRADLGGGTAPRLVLTSLAALVAGAVVGHAAWLATGVFGGLTAGGTTAVGIALIGLISAITQPAESDAPHTPDSLLRSDRWLFLLRWLTVGLTLGLAGGMATVLTNDLWRGLTLDTGRALGIALLVGLSLGLAWAWGRHPWPSYQVARCWLALTGRVPWRFMGFLDDMHHIGVLRRIGTVYQFRHAELRHRLADTRPTS